MDVLFCVCQFLLICKAAIRYIVWPFFDLIMSKLVKRYKNISEDIVLITGGNRGIGKQIALEIAQHSPKHIVLWGRDLLSLKATTDEISTLGVPCTYMVCDIGDKDQIYSKAKDIENTVGNVSILINNAGVVFGNDVIDSNEIDMKRTIEVNCISHFWTLKAFLPYMMEKNHGHIVCMSSMVGLIGIPGIADYAASKFAVTGLMETIKYELIAANKTGVHTTSIHPYIVDTEMFEGCSVRFPKLFPPLKHTYVARRTVEAILTNRYMVLMPKMMYLFLIIKSVLPIECLLHVQKFTGVDRAMNGFHGRKMQEPINCSDSCGTCS